MKNISSRFLFINESFGDLSFVGQNLPFEVRSSLRSVRRALRFFPDAISTILEKRDAMTDSAVLTCTVCPSPTNVYATRARNASASTLLYGARP